MAQTVCDSKSNSNAEALIEETREKIRVLEAERQKEREDVDKSFVRRVLSYVAF